MHTSVIPAPPPSFLRSLPSFLRRQEPARPRRRAPLPPIHPSPLLGGRLGGGWEAASVHQRPSGRPHSSRTYPRFRHSCPSSPSFLRLFRHSCALLRHSCAGRNPRNLTAAPPPSPIHPSPLEGGRLGGGWEAASVHQRPSGHPHSSRTYPRFRHSYPPPPPSFLRPIPSFLRRQEPGRPPRPLPPALRRSAAGRLRWCEQPSRALGSCLRRNDGGGAGMTGQGSGNGGTGEREGRSGCWRAVGGGSVPPTPHLTSPLKGGRDELGKG